MNSEASLPRKTTKSEIDAIRVNGVKLSPGLEPLHFYVRQGEQLTVLGPRHHGQRALMKLLSGQIPYSAGEIKLHGLGLDVNPSAALAKVGYFSEDVGVFQELSVKENVEFLETAHDVCPRGAAVDCLQALELGNVANVLARELAPLDLRKLELASAIIHDPDLLLLDNPTRGLAEADRRSFTELLKELISLATTTLVTTDCAELGSALTDTTCAMFRGRLSKRYLANDFAQQLDPSFSPVLDAERPETRHTGERSARCRPASALNIQSAKAEPRLEALLRPLPGVTSVRQLNESTVRLDHTGPPGFGSDVVAWLAQYGVQVAAIYPAHQTPNRSALYRSEDGSS